MWRPLVLVRPLAAEFGTKGGRLVMTTTTAGEISDIVLDVHMDFSTVHIGPRANMDSTEIQYNTPVQTC